MVATVIREIASASNGFYKHVKKLISQRGCRLESRQFVVEGKRLFEDAVESGVIPYAVLLSGAYAQRAGEYADICPRVYTLTPPLMRALSDTDSPQGIAAVCPMEEEDEAPSLEGDKLVLLCSLQDPGNVGAILRTAGALGVSRVLLSGDCPDLYSPKVLRASMGGVFRVRTSVVADVQGAIHALRARGTRVLAAALAADATPVGDCPLRGKVCMVIGNEGAGLGGDVAACCDGSVMLPMEGGAQSLNAAVAAGILMWEMMRNA